jgi:hypothetical protein
METQNLLTIHLGNTCRKRWLSGIFFLVLLVLLTSNEISKADPNSFKSDAYAVDSVRYMLIEGSTLTETSPVADRPAIQIPIRGYFWLKSLPSDPLFTNYAVNKLKFQSTNSTTLSYSGFLSGTYRVGGEVALLQQMVLKGTINDSKDLLLDSGLQTVNINFPWIEIDISQMLPDSARVFDLHLVAVPWPKIFFSTAISFTSSSGVKASDGDILSASGKIKRRNNELTAKLGIMPIVPDLGLDAVMREKLSNSQTASRTREIFFSIPGDVFSETLGYLHNGDLLSDNGYVVKSYEKFIKPFGPMPPIADYGLDTIAYSPRGEFLFSIEKDFFSERLGQTISNGDLLSEKGYVYKTIGDLLSKFKLYPTFAPVDFGLDAVYVWPWGEVWFSTKSSFGAEQFEMITPGDLLSSYGKVVLRNRELLENFKPTEKIADFGLDALEVSWPDLKADLNEDDIVDSTDYAIFTQACGGKNAIDSDCDIINGNPVDMNDLAAFFEDWLKKNK